MYKFSERSKSRLLTCHVDLQIVANTVILYQDCTVVCGHRGEEEQEKAFREHKSKVHYPNSYHNKKPSLAIDLAPYDHTIRSIPWNDINRFRDFGFFVMGIAAAKDIPITWGADWNKNYDVEDERWCDWPHFQLEVRE